MRFLSFFKSRQVAKQISSQQPITKIPAADANTAQLVTALLQVDEEKRDKAWHLAFYQNIQTASFECGEPHIITGTGGFSFFVLKTPEPGHSFEAICIRELKDFLLEKGLGIAINPNDTSAEWLFSYGDILNLHISNGFLTDMISADIQHIEMNKPVQVIKKGEDILLAQPSARYLPIPARAAIKKFLYENGVKAPKILLLCRKKDGRMIEELAFNIYPANLPSVQQRDELMQAIAWFLPSHYSVISLHEDAWMTKYFEPL